MDTVGVCDLAHPTSAVLEQLEETDQPVLVTRHGRPVAVQVAVLSAIDEEAFHDYVLAAAPEFSEFVRDRSEAEDRWAHGEQDGTPLEDVIAEFDHEQADSGPHVANGLMSAVVAVITLVLFSFYPRFSCSGEVVVELSVSELVSRAGGAQQT